MLIDEVSIQVTAGHGGNGAVAFNKNLMSLGPAGGSGGKGGSVLAEAVSDLGALNQFRHKKQLAAQNGRDGHGQFCDGPDGQDLIIKVPIGTVFTWPDKHSLELTKVGEQILLAKGGKGGRGNFLFRSARNTTPKEFEAGKPGEQAFLHIELKLIADVGFVGLPNVGKSSLLNELTNASAKVANYHFTTLEPNLGVHYNLILADIPGLIEGASEGRGLGTKFLRHVERTKVIFHFLAADSSSPLADYQTIRQELANHNPALLEKPEYIFLSRADLATPKKIRSELEKLAILQKEITVISIHDWDSLEEVKKILNTLQK